MAGIRVGAFGGDRENSGSALMIGVMYLNRGEGAEARAERCTRRICELGNLGKRGDERERGA